MSGFMAIDPIVQCGQMVNQHFHPPGDVPTLGKDTHTLLPHSQFFILYERDNVIPNDPL